MREFNVTVKGEKFRVFAKSHNKAISDGIVLYRKKHKGYTFVSLIPYAHAKLVHPKPLGRPSVMDLDFKGFED